MKRGVARLTIIVGLALFFSTWLVSAADYVCDPSQEIFRISDLANAHGEFFSGTGAYTKDICYDDYFGTFSGSPTRTGGAGNVVVRLSSTSNGHAEIAGLATTGYTNLYFDPSLNCAPVPASQSCPVGSNEIVSLSANTNAQLGVPGQYTGTGAYRVCCTLGTITPPGQGNFTLVQWQNNAGTPIGDPFGSSTSVNRTVRLVARTQFPVGTSLTFNVRERDPILNDNIRTLTATTLGPSSEAVASFTISDADIAAGGNEAVGQFYFTVRATSSAVSSELNTSYLLNVSSTARPNEPPVALITAPVHRGIYYNGTRVEFRQGSQDPDGDSMTYLWTMPEDSFSTTNATFNYTFKTFGQKTITLRATDSQGLWSEHQVGIVVIGPSGLVAFIQQPSHLAVLVDDMLRVRVSANDSFVVKAQGTCPGHTVTCLAGVCPSVTQNWPSGCTGVFPVVQTPRGFNELYFDWTFSDGDTASTVEGYGASTVTKQFGVPSSSLTEYKRADLSVRYTNTTAVPGGLDLAKLTSRSFTLLSGRQCVDNGNTWVEYNQLTGQVIGTWSTSQANGRCGGTNNGPGGGDDCCPSGYACTNGPSGSGSASCQPINGTSCSYYQEELACEDDDSNLARVDPSWDSECGTSLPNGTTITCSCNWINQTQDTGNYCVFSKSYAQGTHNGTSGCTPHLCNYLPTSEPSACVNGYATVTVNAQFVGGTCAGLGTSNQTCQAGNGLRTILCGKPTISLDFFGPWQFVVTFLVIVGIYLVGWLRKHP